MASIQMDIIQEAAERRLERQRDAEFAPWKMCPRLANLRRKREPYPWESVDQCAGCGVPVVFTTADSLGKLHVCVPCVYAAYRAHQINLPGASPADVGAGEYDDDDMMAKLAVAISQSKGGEHKRRPGTPPPSFNPAASWTPGALQKEKLDGKS